jgi:predicted CXXCH cytochrome family protein
MKCGRGVVGVFLIAGVFAPGWAFGQTAADSAGRNACVACHEGLPERLSAPVTQYKEDVHAGFGFGCVECHGGDATASGFAAMDPKKGFLGRPVGRQVLQVCGRCHSDAAFMRHYNPAERVDQVTEYATSVHGQRLLGMGDTKVATCISCHPAHQIRPPDDTRSSVYAANVATTCGKCHADSTYMAPYGIPTNQLESYRKSVHWEKLSGGDLSAPTCNDCHGNHGAAPPGVQWVGNVCGQCHTVMESYFSTSRHAQAFAQMGIPGCVACHGNHAIHATADSMLGMGDGAVCTRCHVAGQAGATAAVAMRQGIDSLAASFALADSLLGSAEHAGMEVSQAQFDLGNAKTALLQARTAVHAFRVDSVASHVTEGIGVTDTAISRGYRALADLRFRRIGLGLSTGVIVLLIASLILKIRQLERKA